MANYSTSTHLNEQLLQQNADLLALLAEKNMKIASLTHELETLSAKLNVLAETIAPLVQQLGQYEEERDNQNYVISTLNHQLQAAKETIQHLEKLATTHTNSYADKLESAQQQTTQEGLEHSKLIALADQYRKLSIQSSTLLLASQTKIRTLESQILELKQKLSQHSNNYRPGTKESQTNSDLFNTPSTKPISDSGPKP